jgi:2-oxoglutarate ferredoxin oxidoreductase subunit alpha
MIANKGSGTKSVEQLESVTIRFCGDSGDGMQLAGTQFTNTSALFGNDISTLPDFPAEIRAPAGTMAGVSGFQIHFSSKDIYTPGDAVHAMVAMNPAALRSNVSDLIDGGVLILNADEFKSGGLKKAGYESNPLEDDSLKPYQVHAVKISTMNREALKDLDIGSKAVDRCKNFFALGLVYWLYGRPMEQTLDWIEQKFGKMPEIAAANSKALKSGYFYGETTETFATQYHVPKAEIAPGMYRKITGNEAIALGFVAASKLSGKSLFLGSYPITPASTILEELNRYKKFGVKTFQAEDEIAAVSSSIGAAFTGALAITSTSGPGLALKSEAISLCAMMELPMVIINIQRGGPSTGLPTKTEQSDLNIAIHGRHGECPLPVIAAQSPADCFFAAIEASRIAMTYMTPVILLSDGYIANGAEPWQVPDVSTLEPIHAPFAASVTDGELYRPYERDDRLVRPWAIPGTAGLEHRLGGLEKDDGSGNVSYDPDNHQHMTFTRAEKVEGIVRDIAPTKIMGESSGQLLVVSWGGTYGATTSAVTEAQSQGLSVSMIHLRHMNPMPADLDDIIGRFEQILVPELNMGQLRSMLAGRCRREIDGLNKIKGKPFLVSEILEKITSMVRGEVVA